MADRDFAYDHPAYLVPEIVNITTTAGNGAISRFVAFTNVILKSVQVTCVTAGTTAGHTLTFRTITGTGTTTTSIGAVTLTTNTTGVTTNVPLNNVALARGEMLTITNGTDATGVAAVAVELNVRPGAVFTV